MNQFYIDDEDNIPDELVKANEERKIIQCNTNWDGHDSSKFDWTI